MALPQAREARPFYQAAQQRLIDADFLLQGGRSTGAVYLAGYGVECMLKAFAILLTPSNSRRTLVGRFRGNRAHDFHWLKTLCTQMSGAPWPKAIIQDLALVSTWTTSLRYMAGTMNQRHAADFIRRANTVIDWIDGRL